MLSGLVSRGTSSRSLLLSTMSILECSSAAGNRNELSILNREAPPNRAPGRPPGAHQFMAAGDPSLSRLLSVCATGVSVKDHLISFSEMDSSNSPRGTRMGVNDGTVFFRKALNSDDLRSLEPPGHTRILRGYRSCVLLPGVAVCPHRVFTPVSGIHVSLWQVS
jgi:hypothetical protein